VIRLAPGAEAEYRRLHDAVWPGVLDRIAESEITNFSIFIHGDLLFSYMEYVGDDFESAQALIAADPESARWASVTSPLQRPIETVGENEWWASMEEIFHFAGSSSAEASSSEPEPLDGS
jgi:L-rhamnose mutarotase